jgi:hypothetical protein
VRSSMSARVKGPGTRRPLITEQDILNVLSRFFGALVTAEERTLRLLESTCEYHDDQTHVLLAAGLRVVPAIAGTLLDLGVTPSRMFLPRPAGLFADHPAYEDEFSHLLSVLGQAFLDDYFDVKSLNRIGRNVAKSGRLDLASLLRAPLESPFNWPDSIPQTLLASLLRGLGVQPEEIGRSAIEQEATRLAKALEVLRSIDSSFEQQQFVISWDGKKHRLEPFGTWGAYQLASDPLPNGSLWVARANVIEPASRFTLSALGELEGLIQASASERDFQQFFQ